MSTRRDFIQQLALLAAGAAALPAQVAAFERYYEANTPVKGDNFIAIDEISLSGLVMFGSTPVRVDFWQEDNLILPAAFNAFGGVYFWRAPPDGKIIALPRQVIWKASSPLKNDETPSDSWMQSTITGHIKYIRNRDMVRQTQIVAGARGVVG